MEEQNSQDDSASNQSTLGVFQQFQDLYAEQLKDTDESCDGLKLKVKILDKWVQDLTDQNVMLVKTVDELESEALKRLSILESNIPQKPQVSSCFSSREVLTPNVINQVESLSQELEQVKQQLSDKEKLVSKYQCRIEELRNVVEKEKSDSFNKVFVHRCSMTENTICDPENILHRQSRVHEELETTQVQLCQMEKEVTQLKKKLKDADSSIKRVRSDLLVSEKNAREMRSALTAEVAEKHDQILALRREVSQLEEQLRQADMQTHFKDDIIKELRKEVKVARSKETLVEVLGIKERSLSHLEHLTEQLEQKEHTISCLKTKLQQYKETTPDTLYRVKQQVDWFTENVSQQCAKGNVPEEFKKCITTMLEELKESIECCNFGPTNTSEPCKDSIEFVSALQTSLDQSQEGLCESWTTILETADKINDIELTRHVEQWKKFLCKQQSLQQKLQELVKSIIHLVSSSEVHTGAISKSMDSLHFTICSFKDELNKCQPRGKGFSSWLKKLHSLISESISKIQEVSHIAATMRSDEEKVISEMETKLQSVDALELELDEVLTAEQKAYDKLYKMEKTQRTKLDTLLATILHHHEMWNQQVAISIDMKSEILRMVDGLKQKLSQPPKQSDRRPQSPVEQRSLHVKSLVTQISTDIRCSISDIEHRQNQVGHLELDLSSVRLVLESAQQEIDSIAEECETKDVTQKVLCVLSKLKKEVTNALSKANRLVEEYNFTKQEYMSSSQRILQIQAEFDSLEEELHSFHYYICQDFEKPPKTSPCGKRICPVEEELKNYKKKVKKLNETLDSYFQQHQIVKCPETKDMVQPKNILKEQYIEMQRVLVEKDAAIKSVKDNMKDLRSNLKDRDRLTATQDETIHILQNSLKICQKETEELHNKITCLESKKGDFEKNSTKQIQALQNRIIELKNCLKQSEDMTLHMKGGIGVLCKMMFAELKAQYLQSFGEGSKESQSVKILQNANLELATLAGHLQEDYRCAQAKLSDTYKQVAETERKHQRAEAALHIVIANLKESMCQEQNKLCALLKENKQLQVKLQCISTDLKMELESNSKREAVSNEENVRKISELKKEAKCWSMKVAELETMLKDVQEKLCVSTCHEKELQSQAKCWSMKVADLETMIKDVQEKLCVSTCHEKELQSQAKCWSMKVAELETMLKDVQEKLCVSTCHEKELQSQGTKYKEEICEKQKEVSKLSNIIKSMTEKLKECSTELETERVRHCEAEQKLQKVCAAYEELKEKAKEKETTADKLHVALTQLSNKFVSRRLDSKDCVRHYQEECAKFEALYNTASCKLHSKEEEMTVMMREIERLKSELNSLASAPLQQKEDDSCPFLLGRVQQLSKELQVAHSCQNSYETIIKEVTEKCSKKEDEVTHLKSKLKQVTLQRDTLLSELEREKDEIAKLKLDNSDLHYTLKKIELSKSQISEQMKSMQRMVCDSQVPSSHPACLQPNIELQREISSVLSSQLRGVKQKLLSTKHDYKHLQTAYEELNQKYKLLQKGERDLEQLKDTKSHCTPCMAKSSKSMAHVKHAQEIKDKIPSLKYSSHSKSWHKIESSDLAQSERKWKQKLQQIIRGEEFDASELMNNSSSSN